MRKLVLLTVMVLIMIPSAKALIVTPMEFEGEVEHGDVWNDHFRVVPENISQDISLFYSSPFLIALQNNSIDNLSTYIDIDFNITIPKQFPEGTYTSYIFVIGENETEVVDVVLTIQKTLNFSINVEDNITAGTGDSGFVVFDIKNTGNEVLNIEVLISSNEIDFYLDAETIENINIYPNLSVQVPVSYIISEELDQDSYTVNVTVTNKNDLFSKNKEIIFDIIDTLPPEVYSVEFNGTIKAGYDFGVNVLAFDNLGIENVDVIFDNKTLSSTEMTNDAYRFVHNIKGTGPHQFEVIVNDINNNSVKENFTITLEMAESAIFHDIDYVKINKDELFRFDIFDSDIPVPFCFDMDYIDFIGDQNNDNSTYNFFLYMNEVKKKFNSSANETDNFSMCLEGQNFDFAFKGDEEGRLDVEFILDFADWVQKEKRITIGTDVSERTIKKNVTVRTGSNKMSCIYEEDNQWHCGGLVFPGHVNHEDIGVLMTERQYDDIIEKANETAKNYKIRLDIANGFSGFQTLLIVLIVAGLLVYWVFAVKKIQIDMQ